MLWFIIGLFIGGIVGFFTAAICAASARASRMEDVYRGRREGK